MVALSERDTDPFDDGPADRTPQPPANIPAEQALLGGVLVNNHAYERVAEFLLPEHFANAVHGRIYAAIGTLIERGQIANPVMLKNLFDQDGALAEIGGAQYLGGLVDAAVTIINVPFYARQIQELWLRRQLIALGQELVGDAYRQDLDVSPVHLAETLDGRLADLIATATPRSRGGRIGDAAQQALRETDKAYKREAQSIGLTTGLIDLDDALGGLMPGDLVVLGGDVAQGKTSALVQICDHLASAGIPVGICELEQTAPQLAQRMMAFRSRVTQHQQRRGDVDPMIGWPALIEAAGQVGELPIWVDDTPAMGLGDIRRVAQRWRSRENIRLLAVDHLQLMRSAGTRNDRRFDIDEFVDGLKALAKQLGIPVLLLSQLRRPVTSQDVRIRRPQLSDLKESSAIEAAADQVVFVYREEYYLTKAEPQRGPAEADDRYNNRYDIWKAQLERAIGIAEWVLAKNRHGAERVVRTVWDGPLMRFDNWAGPGRY